MKNYLIALFCLVVLFLPLTAAKKYPYEFSICAIFKDEAHSLKEWIEYHRILGFEHFWLYNNNSTDNYLEILTPYIQDNIVELIHWPSPEGKNWLAYQNAAYIHCIPRSKDRTKWLAVIDTDEFIVPVHGVEHFKKTMKDFEKDPSCGGVQLFWQMYGSSFLDDIPHGKTMVESLLLRAEVDYVSNHYVKSIVRPDRLIGYEIHTGFYQSPYRDYTLNKENIPQRSLQDQMTPINDPIRINHYWTRTLNYFNEVKIPRRIIYEGRPYTQEEIDNIHLNYNAVYDDAILQYVPELRKRLQIN